MYKKKKKKENSVGTWKVNHKGKEFVTYKVRNFHVKTVSVFTQNIKVSQGQRHVLMRVVTGPP